MGVKYEAILWNDFKKRYLLILWVSILVVCLSFGGWYFLFHPEITIETLVIRTSAFIAVSLLHFILVIGPLTRFYPSLLPLLYNRRHLGVTMFFFAAIHGIFCMIQFHALGDTHPIASIFLSNKEYASISQFPFQVFGFFSLLILFFMAATSHDFWLKNLGPGVWKALHMLVYVAYALIVAHVALGILQYDGKPIYWGILILGSILVTGLHLASGIKEWLSLKTQVNKLIQNNFHVIGNIKDIPDGSGKGIWLNKENIAVFRYGNQISAVNNVCRHQQGPLAEGRVVEGCITCPWHGYQYIPENGQSPPPFKEKLKTYRVKLVGDQIWVNPSPLAPGTYVESVKITEI